MNRLFGIDWVCRAVTLCLMLAGVYLLASAGTIKAKAWLAPLLIEQAWQKTLARGEPGIKPWSWADTWPVARLRVPAHNVDLLVLEGDSGNALAFGPGRATAAAPLGTAGQAVIGGHRDTHFAFLENLSRGALLQLELPAGNVRSYAVETIRIADTRREMLQAHTGLEKLVLVTCYPFSAVATGGPLRYVISARPVTLAEPPTTASGSGFIASARSMVYSL